MAISAPGEGFFTSDGVLRADLSGTSSAQQSKAKTTETPASVEDQAASATARQITDAAVISVSNQMNVGDTGFDSGVSELVQQAVASALKNRGESPGQASDLATIGGTYQNEIMALAKEPAERPVAPEKNDDTPGGRENAASNGNGRKNGLSAVGGSYQDEIIKGARKGAKDIAA